MLIQSLISAKKQLDSVSNRVELGSCSFYFNKQDGRHKYALEAFMLLVQDKALLSPQMAYQLQWGRLGTSQKHSYVCIAMNPRSYEATLDEFPDLFPAFEKPDNQFVISSYYASYYAFKSSLKNPEIWFFRYKCRQTSSFQVHFRHTFEGITSTQVDI